MRIRISVLLVASIFIMLLISCDMGNNKTENELSEKRRVEISKLESQIKDIDSKISFLLLLLLSVSTESEFSETHTVSFK